MSKAMKAEKDMKKTKYVAEGRKILAQWFDIFILGEQPVYYESKGVGLRFYYAAGKRIETLRPMVSTFLTEDAQAAYKAISEDWGWNDKTRSFAPSKGGEAEVLNGSREDAFRTLIRLAEVAGLSEEYVRRHMKPVPFYSL